MKEEGGVTYNKTTITQWLWTYGPSSDDQYCHPTGTVKPVNGILNFPLTTKLRNQKDTF